ncbi:hypothetical protein CRYUN_Cryun15aG0126000 [Craigia yunnanensis]
MEAAFIGEAALEAGFGELFRAVVEAIKTAAMFHDVLEELESRLSSIQPIIKDIESFNKVLDKEHETKQLIEIICKGQKFVRKCYTYKLQGLKKSLERFSSKKGSGSGNGMFSQIAVVDSCKVPEPPGKVVGFDVPLKELKMKLFKDGMSVIVVSPQGGTTLVKELC